MSGVILGWQLKRPLDDRDIAGITARVKARYQPLFEAPIKHDGLWCANQGLLHFDVLHGPRLDRYRDDGRFICLSGHPSVTDGSATLFGAKALYERFHAALGRFDRRVLHDINPPFTLCWFDTQRQEVGLAHDGMGTDQFFIAETDKGLVFSNKCWPILQLLEEAPQINHAAWQFWFCLGWFPGSSTPFRNVHHLDPGEFLHADSRTVTRDKEDTFRTWIGPAEGGFPIDLAERARASVESIIALNQPPHGSYGSDLTGGFDSRAICSILIKQGNPCAFRTGGPKLSADVVVARRIARQFNLDWRHTEPPSFRRGVGRPELVDAQFRKMLLWGEGLVQPSRFERFQAGPEEINEVGYLSGGASEISRCPYYRDNLTRDRDEAVVYRRALARFEARIMTAPVAADASAAGVQFVHQQLAKGDAYQLGELAHLDFLYFSEKTRRWQAAHRAINLFDRSVVPFLTIEHIRLAFAMDPIDKAEQRFQRLIINQNVPALLHVPFASSDWYRLRTRILESISSMKGAGRALKPLGWADYLRDEGKGRIDRILASDTPLWHILDRDKSVAKWSAFLQGVDQQLMFPLGLMAFDHWHTAYFDGSLTAAPRSERSTL